MLALLGSKNDGFDACRSQNLNHFLTAALRQMIRKESPITDDHTECRFYAHWMISTPSHSASRRECIRQTSGGSRVLLSMALDEFFQVLARVDNMFPQSSGSNLRIFRLAGCEEFAVRLAGSVVVAGKDKMETGVAVAIDVQSLQEREHERTIGGSVEGGMKTPVPLAPGLHFGILLERLLVRS